MGILKYRPEYPVIHQSPGFGLIFRNFNLKDYSIWAGVTAVSFPVGFYAGNINRAVRGPFMWFTASLGFASGLAIGLMRSGGRLLGTKPNQAEASYYPYRLDFPNYQVRTEPFRVVTEEEQQEIMDNPRY